MQDVRYSWRIVSQHGAGWTGKDGVKGQEDQQKATAVVWGVIFLKKEASQGGVGR